MSMHSQESEAPVEIGGIVRTAVIVAAGQGGRLAGADVRPKPLIPIVGVPLVRRVMHAAAQAGIERFVVVVGHRSDELRAALPALVPPGAKLEVLDNPRWEEPNGVSLLVAARALTGPFALLMADHLFAPARLRAARVQHARMGRALLVVEEKNRFGGDLADATRVELREGRVVRLGKELERFDAIDSGLFVLDARETTAALERAGPSPSISAGMQQLADAGQLDALELDDGWWQDVDTPADLARAEKQLFAALVKPSDGFMARHVNRRISLAVTRRVWNRGVGPNTATTVTLLVGLAAGVAFAQGAEWRWGLLGAALFQLHSILDGVDGELARLLCKESRTGALYDLVSDNLTHAAVFAGIAIGQSASARPGPWAMLGTCAVLGVLASTFAVGPLLLAARPATGRALALVLALGRRDFTYLLFPLAVFELLGAFLWAAAIGTWIYALTALAVRRR